MDADWNIVILVFNAIIWLFSFVIYQCKQRYFGIGSVVLLLYTIISIVAIHYFFQSNVFDDLDLFPFLYLYGMILIIACPLLNLQENKNKVVQEVNHKIFNIFLILLIGLSLIGISNFFNDTIQGVISLLVDSDYGKEAYGRGAAAYMQGKRTSGIGYVSVLSNIAKQMIPIVWMYYMTFRNKNNIILILLTFCLLLSPSVALASGSRYAVVIFFMEIGITFLLLRKHFPRKTYKYIKTFLLLVITFVGIAFLALTLSRQDSNISSSILSIERYASESILHFNNHCLDAGGIRYGDKTITLFKDWLGLNPARDYFERLSKYSHMTINESLFYTFVGDFTLDFGPILSLFIFIFISLISIPILRIRNNCLTFHQYCYICILAFICIGFFQFPFGDIVGNLKMLTLLLISFGFKCIYDLHKYIHKKRNVTYHI